MRSTIIPAQITTVEDKIVGSLNVSQILLLLFPVFATFILYAFFPPEMNLATYKVGLAIIIAVTSVFLAIRYRDKIIAKWLIVLFRFYCRPNFYLNDKNDESERIIDLPPVKEVAKGQVSTKPYPENIHSEVSISDLIKLNKILRSKRLAVSFEYGRKR
jgi:hypothetical protein